MSLNTITNEVLQLTINERLMLVQFIMESLKIEEGFKLTEEQELELGRRSKELEMGEVEVLTIEQSEKEIYEKYGF